MLCRSYLAVTLTVRLRCSVKIRMKSVSNIAKITKAMQMVTLHKILMLLRPS